MDEEDTLEQKMDQFKKTQNRSRVKKHKPEPEIPFQSKKVDPSFKTSISKSLISMF